MGPIHLESLGAGGSTIAFVHPTPADSSIWIHQMVRFSAAGRTVAVDLPGYGRSPRLEPEDDLTDVARSVWDAFDRAGVHRSVLVGMSAGSTVVQRMAAMEPERTEALVLTGGGYFAPDDRRFRSAVRTNIGQFLERGPEMQVAKFSEAFATGSVDLESLDYLRDILTARRGWLDVEGVVRLYERLLDDPSDATLRSIACPTLVISGDRDPGHAAHAELARRIAGARFVTMPGAGHMCHVEQPAGYDRYVLGFLRRIGLNPVVRSAAPTVVDRHVPSARLGQGPRTMAFIDGADDPIGLWFYQMMHGSTWFDCRAIDLADARDDDLERSPETLAAWAWNAIDANEVVLVGMGATAAVLSSMARLRPDRTAGLILVSDPTRRRGRRGPRSVGPGSRPAKQADRMRYVAALREARSLADPRTTARGTIGTLLLGADVGRIAQPTLMVAGSDAGRPTERWPQIGDAESVTIDDAGNLCQLERPAVFARAVDRFLRRLGWLGA
jgi:3-oxoadipate enol-lactonase